LITLSQALFSSHRRGAARLAQEQLVHAAVGMSLNDAGDNVGEVGLGGLRPVRRSVLVRKGEIGTANDTGQFRLLPRELKPRAEFDGDFHPF